MKGRTRKDKEASKHVVLIELENGVNYFKRLQPDKQGNVK